MDGELPPDDQSQRQLSPVGLYSHAADVVQKFPQMRGTPQQFKAMLTKQGVKPDEFKYSNYDQAFAGKPMVTRDELAQHFNASVPPVQETTLGGAPHHDYDGLLTHSGSEAPTKFHSYTLPGGTNYRETLLHLPPKYGTWTNGDPVTAEDIATPHGRDTAARVAGYSDDTYSSSHWDTPNVLAHLRMSDRALPGGQKALHLEELQSDWGQQGREKGFEEDRQRKLDELIAAEKRSIVAHQLNKPDKAQRLAEYNELEKKYGKHVGSKGLPSAPYVDSTQKWVDLGLKRALHEAAKGGYHKLVVTPGEEQAKRYDLSKHINEIHYSGSNLVARDHQGKDVMNRTGVLPEQLPEIIGKEAAEKLLNQPKKGTLRSLHGQDLKIGGEGMKAFYDKMLPAALEKLAKKHDPEAKVALNSSIKAPAHSKAIYEGERHPELFKAHSLNITPKMRESILKGQPAYAGGGRIGFAEGGVPEQPDHPARIPTRLVTSKKGGGLPTDNVDMAAFKSTPELYQKNVDLVRDYPNTPRRIAKQPHDKLAEQFIEHAKNNLLDLHDRVPDAVKARSKLWYKGANRIVKDLGQQYKLPDHSVAGAIAALSPQKDWFQNVSLAKRVIEAMHGGGRNFYAGFTTTPAMEATFKGRSSLNKPKYMPLLDAIKGKSLHDLDQTEGSPHEKAARKALWIRLHDETYNSPSYPLVTPEGNFGEPVKTKGGAERKAGWGSLTEISKAIRALEAAKDPSQISALMGEKHKVRNFYNNMLDPDARHGDVTIDTHAVAAALMRALAGKSTEVAHNFANSTAPGVSAAGGSAISGIQGTYPLYAEAYRRAAKERGILPREMQSITWEGIRSMFNDTFKSNKNNVKAIDDIWEKHRSGKLTQKQAREQVYAFAGGLKNPDWFSGHDEAPQHSPDQGKLPRPGVSGSSTATPLGRGRGRAAGAVPAAPPAEVAPEPVLAKADGGVVDAAPHMHAGAGSGAGRLEKMHIQSGDMSPDQKLLPLISTPFIDKAIERAQEPPREEYKNGGVVAKPENNVEALERLTGMVAHQGETIDKLTRILSSPQVFERDDKNRVKRVYREMPR